MSSKSVKPKNSIALFEQKEIRKVWDSEKERWFFSVVDVVEVLTESDKPRDYWYRLKKRASEEEKVELSTICRQLKMRSTDGKLYKTDAADTEGILRIIQSIPSKKAEPFKRWLARVGRERIDEINDPELAAKRMRDIYKAKGYSEVWIEQRERGIAARHRLTEEWNNRGATSGRDFAILTNEIYKGGFGLDAKEYKEYKNLSREQNLRDSMTPMELVLTNLGEVTAAELHRKNESYGVKELKNDTKNAGGVVKMAREAAEERIGAPVVSKQNYLELTEPGAIEAPDEQEFLDE
ncbi:Bro-N domain-containing protein [Candidatus Saccharibacteria bacterium]|nr:Bro-N domain-containing protein [Candidatus Saccharibacteria bacterium]MBR6123097.1 Bro-N domain-containing protein [Candidatus Saccharibacteria bacterium]